MKKLLTILALIGLTFGLQAQTIPQDALNLGSDVLNGPWGIAAGYGTTLSGAHRNLAFEVVSYDFVTNVNNSGFSSGLVVGYSQLWGNHEQVDNQISGGWNFSETGTPLAFTGVSWLTNITATAEVYQLVATPKSGNAIGSITGTSLTIDVYDYKDFHLNVLGAYEARAGQGDFDGNWGLIGLAVTHKF